MPFERVARLAEIPEDCGLLVQLDGEEIGLYRVGNAVVALENSCPHAGYPLHLGVFDGQVVICSAHGWEYDVCTGLPPGLSKGHPLRRFAVRIAGDDVLIDPRAELV